MATDRSLELQQLARRVADALPPEVTDVVLTGSTSHGLADADSDVELLVVSERLPEELPLGDLDSWDPGIEGAMWYGGFFEGEFVELIWWPPAHVEERVGAIAVGSIVDHQRLRTAEAIVNGIPLRGERHAVWVGRLARYPDGLAAAIVADAVLDWFDQSRSYRSLLREGDALVLAQRLAQDAEQILRVVFALNEEWEPGWKRLPQRLEALAVKPERLAERVDAAVRALDPQAMRELAAETLALAPQTDGTRRARSLLEQPL